VGDSKGGGFSKESPLAAGGSIKEGDSQRNTKIREQPGYLLDKTLNLRYFRSEEKMGIYRFETTVTKDGRIILPRKFERMFTHRVELVIKDKTEKKPEKKLEIPAYLCDGKVKETNFSREEIYDYRI